MLWCIGSDAQDYRLFVSTCQPLAIHQQPLPRIQRRRRRRRQPIQIRPMRRPPSPHKQRPMPPMRRPEHHRHRRPLQPQPIRQHTTRQRHPRRMQTTRDPPRVPIHHRRRTIQPRRPQHRPIRRPIPRPPRRHSPPLSRRPPHKPMPIRPRRRHRPRITLQQLHHLPLVDHQQRSQLPRRQRPIRRLQRRHDQIRVVLIDPRLECRIAATTINNGHRDKPPMVHSPGRHQRRRAPFSCPHTATPNAARHTKPAPPKPRQNSPCETPPPLYPVGYPPGYPPPKEHPYPSRG